MVKALDLLLMLHAEHEQNCSTSTVRLVGSSQANMFASVSAASTPSTARCRGANEAVLNMLRRIKARASRPRTSGRRSRKGNPASS